MTLETIQLTQLSVKNDILVHLYFIKAYRFHFVALRNIVLNDMKGRSSFLNGISLEFGLP